MDREAWHAEIHGVAKSLTRRGSQGASRAASGKSGLHARGEGATRSCLESARPDPLPSGSPLLAPPAFATGAKDRARGGRSGRGRRLLSSRSQRRVPAASLVQPWG